MVERERIKGARRKKKRAAGEEIEKYENQQWLFNNKPLLNEP